MENKDLHSSMVRLEIQFIGDGEQHYIHLHSSMVRLEIIAKRRAHLLLLDLHSSMVRLEILIQIYSRIINEKFTFQYG